MANAKYYSDRKKKVLSRQIKTCCVSYFRFIACAFLLSVFLTFYLIFYEHALYVDMTAQRDFESDKAFKWRQGLSNSVGSPSRCFEQHLTSYYFQEVKYKGGGLRKVTAGGAQEVLPVSLLPPPPRHFPPNKVQIVLCSDNIDAAVAVVRGAMSTASDPERMVIHIFTTAVHVAAYRVLFQSYNDGSIIPHKDNEDNCHHVYVHEYLDAWFPAHTQTTLGTDDHKFQLQKYKNPLNFLRFYLIEAFQDLKMFDVAAGKILLLDDDLVINGDLGEVYDSPLESGKANKKAQFFLILIWIFSIWMLLGTFKLCISPLHLSHTPPFFFPLLCAGHAMSAVENCDAQPLRDYFDFKEEFLPHLNAAPWNTICKISLGMNVIDLKEWKKQGITQQLLHWMKVNTQHHIYRAGTLPPVMLVFAARRNAPYRIYTKLNPMWHHINLGWRKDYTVDALMKYKVLHYNGMLKPWIKSIAVSKYRDIWLKNAYDTSVRKWCTMTEKAAHQLIHTKLWLNLK